MKKILMVIISIILFYACKTIHYVTYNISPNKPALSGKVSSSVVKSDVSIIFDKYLIPHIEASNDYDAFYALGYVHAMERLFQIELMKRFAYGRVAETFGNVKFGTNSIFADAVTMDVWLRTIGLWRAAEVSIKDMDEESGEIAEAYCNGINDYIKNGNIPIEFKLLGIKPEPIKPVHLIAIGRITGWSLSVNSMQELIRYLLSVELGEEIQRELFPPLNYKGSAIVDIKSASSNPEQRSGMKVNREYYESALTILRGFSVLENLDVFSIPKNASNNWAISGEKTISGFPILANDPHLQHSAPSIFYAVHLKTPDLNVIGVSIPGTPAVILGHNERVAWAATNTFADVQDLYFEKIDPKDPNKYLTASGSKEFYYEEHTIFEKREDGKFIPHNFTIRHTIHGPVLNDAMGSATRNLPLITLKTTMYHSAGDFKAVYGFMKSKNIYEFREALKFWDIPIQNWVVADRDGNIGYFPFGRIPKRIGWDGTMPVEGWSGRYEWDGYIPYEELPQLINPGIGIIVTANNKVVEPDKYKYPFTLDAMPSYRADRIKELLSKKDKWDVESVRKIQMDVYSKQAEYIMPTIKKVLSNSTLTDFEKRAFEFLKNWDYSAREDSIGATLFFVTHKILFEMTLKDNLSPVLYNLILNTPYSHGFFDRFIVENENSKLWDIKTTEIIEKKDDIILLAFKKAVFSLRENLTDNIQEWRWGRIHQILFAHPLGSDERVSKTFNVGLIPTSGARETVKAASYRFESSLFFTDIDGAAFRQVCDMREADECDIIIDLGQSGWAKTDGYSNALPLYLKGEFWDTSMNPKKYRESLRGEIRILPISKIKR
ncbi:MAG: penicillin acylase family protein [Myxococcota bacterium]